MSSTNRSNARNSHKEDYYVTPIHVVEEFIDAFIQVEEIPKSVEILDPTAGGDLTTPMSYPTALKNKGFTNIITHDFRPDSPADLHGDYFDLRCNNLFDIIITNPPFNLAIEITEKALTDVRDGGLVIMLLRLNFFGSKGRKYFFDKMMPKFCFVHHKRISFTGGGTDSVEYAHFVWQRGYTEKFTKLYHI